jgi:hypothetical protein
MVGSLEEASQGDLLASAAKGVERGYPVGWEVVDGVLEHLVHIGRIPGDARRPLAHDLPQVRPGLSELEDCLAQAAYRIQVTGESQGHAGPAFAVAQGEREDGGYSQPRWQLDPH